MIKSIGQRVATFPPPEKKSSNERKVGQNLSFTKHEVDVVELTVAFPSEEGKYLENEVVYVSEHAVINLQWAKVKYKMGNKEVVLVPYDQILFHQRS